MASRFDGSDFLGLDTDAVGDGQSGTSQPLDTYLENVIDGNIIHDWERGWSVGYSFYDDGETPRPVATYAQACFFRFDLFADPAPDQIDISLLYDLLNDEDNDMRSRFTVKIGPYADPYREEVSTVEAADVSGAEPAVTTISVNSASNLTGRSTFLPVWICFENLRERTDLTEVDAASVTSQTEDVLKLTDDIALSETQVLAIDRLTSSTGGYIGAEFFGMSDVLDADNDGSNTFAGIRLPPGVTPPDAKFENARSKAMDYAEIYGITIDVQYDTDEYGQYGPKRASSMQAQSTVRGRDTVQHAQRANATQVRPRLLHAGVPNADGQQFSSRITRWHHTDANEGDSVVRMFSFPIEPVEPGGQLHFRHNLFPTCQYETIDPVTMNRASRFPYSTRDLAEVIETYYRAMKWEFTYIFETLEQDATSWSTVASTTVDRGVNSGDPLRHYIAQLVSTSPWIMQTGLMQDSNANFSRTFAEGLLYQQDAQVLSQNFISGTLELPDPDFYDPTGGRQACRMRVQAEWSDYDTNATPQAVLDLGASRNFTQDDLETIRLATCGFSLYQLCEV